MINRVATLMLFVVGVIMSGCQSLPSRPSLVQPRIVDPDVPLERLRDSKQDGLGNLVVVLTEKNTNLPAEAAPLTPLLMRAFGALQPSGIYFYSGRVFVQGGFTEKGDPDFNAKPPLKDLKLLEQRHQNSDKSPAEVILLGASAHMDRDVYRVRKNATIRGLAEAGGGYVEGSIDFEVEESVSVMTITLGTQAPTYEATPTSVQIKAELLKQRDGAQFGVFVFGSGGKLSKDVVLTQGLSEAIEVCVARAVLELCGQLMGVDAEQFLVGDKPAARPRMPARVSVTASDMTGSSAPHSAEATPDAAAATQLVLHYQIRTETGHVVDTDPAVLRSGDRFSITVMASADCFLYLLAQNASGFSLLHPRPGDSSAQLPAGARRTIPERGSYTLDAKPGVENLILVASAKPIEVLEAVFRRHARADQNEVQMLARRIAAQADQAVFSRTKLPSAMRLTWPLAPGMGMLTARLVVDHR